MYVQMVKALPVRGHCAFLSICYALAPRPITICPRLFEASSGDFGQRCSVLIVFVLLQLQNNRRDDVHCIRQG